MRFIKGAALWLALLSAVLLVACRSNKEAKTQGLVEAVSIAVDTYLYGYPLVTFDTVRRQQTNVAKPDGEHAPMGQMNLMRSYPAVDNHCCAAPNADTLYTIAWLDVSAEPWVLSIPDMGNRYYIIPMLDGYSEVFSVASPATTGYRAQTYAVTGPGWTGTLPPGMTQVKSPTGMVWVLGRVYCTGTFEDYKAVHALQDKFTLVPLSSYGKPYSAPPSTVDPNFDMKTAVRKQVEALDIDAYFTRLAQLMKTNPPTAADAPLVARMAKIGLVPGQDYDASKLSGFDKAAIKAVPKLALLKMVKLLKDQKTTNGWLYFTSGVGNWGTDYPLRAMSNMLGPGWNRAMHRDAISAFPGSRLRSGARRFRVLKALTSAVQDRIASRRSVWAYQSGTARRSGNQIHVIEKSASRPCGRGAYWSQQGILDGSWKPPRIVKSHYG